MNDFDDLVTGALDARGASAAPGAADPSDAISRARHHRSVRRGVAASCVGVLAIGAVVGLMLRSPGGEPSVADGPGAQDPATSCPDGQILSSEGDIVLHEGQPYAVSAGQCITATKQDPVITTCEVSVEGGTTEAGVVSSSEGTGAGTDSKGCVLISGEPCPAPGLLPDGTPATTIVVKPDVAPPKSAWACATGCGHVFVTSGGAPSGTVPPGDAPIVTSFTASTESDSGDGDGPPNMVVEACAAANATLTPPPPDDATDTTVTFPQG